MIVTVLHNYSNLVDEADESGTQVAACEELRTTLIAVPVKAAIYPLTSDRVRQKRHLGGEILLALLAL